MLGSASNGVGECVVIPLALTPWICQTDGGDSRLLFALDKMGWDGMGWDGMGGSMDRARDLKLTVRPVRFEMKRHSHSHSASVEQ